MRGYTCRVLDLAKRLTNFIHSLPRPISSCCSCCFCRSFIPLISLCPCSSILYNAIVVDCGPAGRLCHGLGSQYGGFSQGFAPMCCTLESYIKEMELTSVSWNVSSRQSLHPHAARQTRPVSVQTRASLQTLRPAWRVLALLGSL